MIRNNSRGTFTAHEVETELTARGSSGVCLTKLSAPAAVPVRSASVDCFQLAPCTGLGHRCRQNEWAANSRSISRSPFALFCLLFRHSPTFTLAHQTHTPLPSSFTLVSLCAAFFLPRQSIYLCLASSSRAAPGVKWRTVGGRARELGHLTARPLPCWHDPRYVMRARTRACTQTLTQDSGFSNK